VEKFLQTVKDFRKLVKTSRGSPNLTLLAASEKDMRSAYRKLPKTIRIEALTKANEIMAGIENKAGFGAWLKLDLAEMLKRKELDL